MKIAVTSDTHNLHFEFPEAELFVHCGDMTNGGSIQELARFAQRLNRSDYEAGVIVPGNHDRIFQTMPRLAAELFHRRFRVLVDEDMVWKGIRFWGSPWTPPFGDYAFMRNEAQLRRAYSWIPEKLDVLVTHGPPRGILDKNLGGSEVGSLALRTAVMSRQIRCHVFGHIHSMAGREPIEYRPGAIAINACATVDLDGEYGMQYQPRVLEI